MNYSETIAYLYGLEATRGWDLKLERMRSALATLGHPERAFASVLVAGTNGKGTTSALVEAALRAAGVRVGLYTSPHLVHFTERIRVDGEEVGRDEVVRWVGEICSCSPPQETGLTFFEVATLLAIFAFAEKKVDVAVLEVGLGGRLDATNAVEPICSAVTSIGLDHQAYLGDCLGDIAGEKAGVMRRGRATVLGTRIPEEAARVLIDRATEVGADLVHAEEPPGGQPALGIPGAPAREDGLVAWALLDRLEAEIPGLRVPREARSLGWQGVCWPGRMEVIPGRPTWILDGAHNEESVDRLCEELPRLAGGPVRLLFAALEDKPWEQMAEKLLPLISSVSVVGLPGQPRAVEPGRLARAFGGLRPLRSAPEPISELRRMEEEDDTTPILVAGSLFLVGEVYAERLERLGCTSVYRCPPGRENR